MLLLLGGGGGGRVGVGGGVGQRGGQAKRESNGVGDGFTCLPNVLPNQENISEYSLQNADK